jgi:hypothetical protein
LTFLLAGHRAAARRLHFTRAVTLRLAVGVEAVGSRGGLPGGHAPDGTSEGFELKTFFLPATARLA